MWEKEGGKEGGGREMCVREKEIKKEKFLIDPFISPDLVLVNVSQTNHHLLQFQWM